jgi:hypothetical protein
MEIKGQWRGTIDLWRLVFVLVDHILRFARGLAQFGEMHVEMEVINRSIDVG